MENKRSECCYGKTCTHNTCENCKPSKPPRPCYHYSPGIGVCCVYDGYCDDGFMGKLCAMRLDPAERPSKFHIWDFRTRSWKDTRESDSSENSIDIKSNIESCIRTIQKLTDDLGDKITESVKADIEKQINYLKERYLS